MNIRKWLLSIVLPPPIPLKHQVYSMSIPPGASRSEPNERLVDLAMKAAGRARNLTIAGAEERGMGRMNKWPGEHYRMLAALVAELQAKTVVEIGTYQGRASYAMRSQLPPDGRLVSFDVVPWTSVRPVLLKEEDFADGRMRQELADLRDFEVMKRYADVLRAADFILVDAAKDGVMEQLFLDNFRKLGLPKGPIVMFDDIHEWKMLKIWHELPEPKLDITSFAHWTGSGLVDWPRANN
ncbi:MAG TPA: hypothetical protein VL357_07350 [Rariglobus sp.]|jgi:predicted O-methyltransferase YrrM|nr:hypothetical protein [Rariglobus sp.]